MRSKTLWLSYASAEQLKNRRSGRSLQFMFCEGGLINSLQGFEATSSATDKVESSRGCRLHKADNSAADCPWSWPVGFRNTLQSSSFLQKRMSTNRKTHFLTNSRGYSPEPTQNHAQSVGTSDGRVSITTTYGFRTTSFDQRRNYIFMADSRVNSSM